MKNLYIFTKKSTKWIVLKYEGFISPFSIVMALTPDEATLELARRNRIS
jgi:hypothetical protein